MRAAGRCGERAAETLSGLRPQDARGAGAARPRQVGGDAAGAGAELGGRRREVTPAAESARQGPGSPQSSANAQARAARLCGLEPPG